jgi:hypothetical protein
VTPPPIPDISSPKPDGTHPLLGGGGAHVHVVQGIAGFGILGLIGAGARGLTFMLEPRTQEPAPDLGSACFNMVYQRVD